jgi:enamine deaminase RidA (YjgF/YER057c/UK114 family)
MKRRYDNYANYFPATFIFPAAVFHKNHPARTCYEAGNLPLGAAVEIEVIAIAGDTLIEIVSDDAAKL